MHYEGGRDGAAAPEPESQNGNRAAIEAALTPDSYDKILAFARKRCAALRRFGLRTESDYEHQLVADVIADTYTGHLTWRPEACALDTHLCQTIKSRTNYRLAHDVRFPKVRPVNHDEWENLTAATPSLEASLLLKETTERVLADIESEFFERRDARVLRIVDAWRAGQTRRQDVALTAGFTVRDYDNARDRIRRFLEMRELS